ncbi:MAG: hypothetical protein ABW048_11160 [Sphingobium sp.]
MRKSLSLAVLAGILALGACGKKPHEEPVENDLILNEPENVTNEVTPPPPPPPAETNSVAPVDNRAAPPEITEEQQMQDDADATGMTSRLPDDEGRSAVVSGK